MFDLPLSVRLGTVATFGYALGCVNAAYYIVRRQRGSDIREQFSGNAGATNAGRVMGRRGYLIVLALDAAKGSVAALIGLLLAGDIGAAAGGAMSVVGHVWPAQLGWRGGMGVATTIGVVAVLDPTLLLASIGIALACYAVSLRYMASGVIAISLAPIVAWLLGRTWMALAPIIVMVAIVVFAHRNDLRDAFGPPPDA